MTPTHHYTAEALGLTPEEMADPSLDEPANVDFDAFLRWLEAGEGEPWSPEVSP